MDELVTVKIFERSSNKHGLRCTFFCGGRENKSFNSVQNIYGDKIPMKNINGSGIIKSSLVSRCINWGNTKNLGKRQIH